MRTHGAFINARYSTDNQNPDSIEVQVSKCTQWCHENGIPVLGVYADEATSGMKETRTRYEDMMRDLRFGMADTVVIYDQSRMFRDMVSWFNFRKALSAMGVRVVSVTQPMIGKDLRDPMNFMTEGATALFNQIHVLQTRQKVIEKMRFMARNGQHTGGKPALGYRVEDGRLVIDEREAQIVRRIFREYDQGHSYKQIIDGLNRDGLKTKRGSDFGSNSLHDLLHNEKYIGVLVYGQSPYREDGTRNTHSKDGTDVIRIEDAVPAIIEKDQFERVQKRMLKNKRLQGGRPPVRREYPLRSKVFCGDCKAAMSVSISLQKYFYYRCTGKKRTHQCQAMPISAEDLEKKVADAVRSILGTPAGIESLLQILREEREKLCGGAAEALRALIEEDAQLAVKIDHATEAVLNGLTSPMLVEKIRNMEARRSLLDSQMKSLKKSVDAAAIPEDRLRQILQTILTEQEANDEALLSLVTRVEVTADNITIWTILDPDPNLDPDYTAPGITTTSGLGSGVP